MAVRVEHEPDKNRFVVKLPGGEKAVLEYRHVDLHTVDFRSTFTPPSQRGKGVAEKLVRQALDWAEGHGLKVIPSCWYVRRVLDRDAREARESKK